MDFLVNVTWLLTLLPVPCSLSRPETQQKAPVSAPPPPPPPPPPPEPAGPPEPEEEILGSDDEEQEDPADYCKGQTVMPQIPSVQGPFQQLLCHTQLQSDSPVSAPVCKFLLCPPPVLIAIRLTCMMVVTPAAQGYLPDSQVLCGRCATHFHCTAPLTTTLQAVTQRGFFTGAILTSYCRFSQLQLMKLSLASPAIALQFLRKAAVMKVCACTKSQFSLLIFPWKGFIGANYLQECLFVRAAVFLHLYSPPQVYVHGCGTFSE